jgi:predicted amidophosphoribosyltransferase
LPINRRMRPTRRPDPNRCPQCRERVTPFAAGCALCGADLDPRRHRAGPSLAQRIGSWVAALTRGGRL